MAILPCPLPLDWVLSYARRYWRGIPIANFHCVAFPPFTMKAPDNGSGALGSHHTQCRYCSTVKLQLPQLPMQSGACGPVSAHAMYAPAWRCRGRADVESLDGRSIGDEANGGPREELPQILHTAVDIPTNVIGIILLEGCRRRNAASQHAVSEAWCKPFDLVLQALGHVDR